MKIKIIRLPDINKYSQLPQEYDNYGRFGLTNDGNFYCCGIHSSHSGNTRIGGYWASDKKNKILYLSARGNTEDFPMLVEYIGKADKLKCLLKIAGL